MVTKQSTAPIFGGEKLTSIKKLYKKKKYLAKFFVGAMFGEKVDLKMSWKKVRNFFWWCSGANIDELRKYPTDYNTYFSIGAAVFLTALLAFFSGGYWFYIVFDSVYVSIAFALIYAMLIFNIDRFVVLNMSKSGRGLSMLLNALPRILLAVVISLFIANPLELRYFETEIKNKIEDNLELYRQAYIDSSSFVLQQQIAKA